MIELKCSCKFDFKEGKKIICKKHDQALLYGYFINGEIRIMCQVGEDEIISKKRFGKGLY